MLTLKDTSFLTIDKVPLKDANEMRMYLDAVHQDRLHTGKCHSSRSHQWRLREGAVLWRGLFSTFSHLSSLHYFLCMLYLCRSFWLWPQFLLCAFVTLNNKQRWNDQELFLLYVHRYLKNSCLYHTCIVSFLLIFPLYFGCFKDRNFSSRWVNGQYKGNP